ncbi:MAG: F0F1 ATP synthase subunit delta [Gammaproteobacteria bacterium HGW-Gammaproteobacteria-8]|nr:MAG: F0F1 ATP synthase subunit delta [Gammaproteobacteria bacterium HGW-Gammaproteobacteria-8]
MLAETTLARPYARAAFGLADQAGTLERWSANLARAAVAVDSPAMQRVIGHPRVDERQLLGLFDAVLGDALDLAFRSFVKVLMHYRRLELLPEIASQFEQLKRARNHKLMVNVTSAVPMEQAQLEQLAGRLRERFGSEIEMQTDIDESLIGGLVVRAGDKVIDASVRGRLEQLGRALVR